MSNLYWLTDAQMARLKPFFPKSHGKPRVDDRRDVSQGTPHGIEPAGQKGGASTPDRANQRRHEHQVARRC